MSDIDRAREINDAVLIDEHWSDAEEKEFLVEVKFFVTAFDDDEATQKIEDALEKGDIEFQVELTEEVE